MYHNIPFFLKNKKVIMSVRGFTERIYAEMKLAYYPPETHMWQLFIKFKYCISYYKHIKIFLQLSHL